MRSYNAKDKMEGVGYCVLFYAPPNYGKTHSALTLSGKTRLINCESKDPRNVLAGSEDIVIFDDFVDFQDMMGVLDGWIEEARSGKIDYQNLFFDGASFQMSRFKMDFEDSHFEKKREKEKKEPHLFDRFGLGEDALQGWGALASAMKRVTNGCNKLTKYGINVFMTAWEMENPKYSGIGGERIDAGPAFQGREFSNLLAGYFDLIGRVVAPPKFEDSGVAAPVISFVQDEAFGSYLCRATGKLAPRGKMVPLNWAKIIGFLNK